MNKFSLLVFDWDGTLVDSIERIVTSLQHASMTAAEIQISETHAKSVIGLGLKEAIVKLHPQLDEVRHSTVLDDITDAYRQHYLYENPVPAPLFSGVDELLEELRQQDYTLAISTGKSRAGLDRSIQEHGVAEYFSTTRCAGESRSKPHPEMLHEILKELNFSASEALMIGDSEHDLMMAKNASMRCVGVTHGVQDAKTLEKHEPLACLNDITALSDFLNHNTF
jgi:phosphoglycolate phosphatase